MTSRVGLEGINAIENDHLLVYDSLEEAADKILLLHSNPDLRCKIAQQGRALVEQSYDWDIIYPKISGLDIGCAGRQRNGEFKVETSWAPVTAFKDA